MSTGNNDVESLWGKINQKDFGSRFEREKAPINSKENKSTQYVNWDVAISSRATSKKRNASEFDWQIYKPKTSETQRSYELFLTFIQEFVLMDQPQDVIRSAADEILLILKDERKNDTEKKTQCESILGSVENDKFVQLLNLSKKLVDFVMPSKEELAYKHSQSMQNENPIEIAVVFSDEDEDENEVEDLDDVENEDNDHRHVEVFASDQALISEKGFFEDLHQITFVSLQNLVASYFPDSQESFSMSTKIFNILQSNSDFRECENELVELLEFDKFELIKILLKNRFDIVFGIQLTNCTNTAERSQLENRIKNFPEGADFLHRYNAPKSIAAKLDATSTKMEVEQAEQEEVLQTLDIEKMSFSQGSHVLTNKRCKLPEKSFKVTKANYEEIHIPAPSSEPISSDERLILIEELPQWIHPVFKGSHSLNRIQSKVCPAALNRDENLLICAPTGSGKTNVALLSMLQTIGQFRDESSGRIDKDSFKIIYIAPMKALVQEIVGTMSIKLAALSLKVSELTGDSQLEKHEIASSQIIVATPEKWDVITRKGSRKTFLSLVRLVIIDEIHLLHDERGPVIEAVVARTLRNIEETQEMVRIVGLSATLPNYLDVAKFLRVNINSGMFFFNNSYRPCPLTQQYIGITEKKALKRFQISNEIVYEKIMQRAGKVQMIVFVHSRRETFNVANIIKDACLEQNTLGMFFPEDSTARREILKSEAESVKNVNLKEILPFGFAIHHAGLSKQDRKLVEDLFSDGHVQVLFSTATLAWGVNLPAHTVIVKGTQVFSPEQGKWVELSPQDIMQMLGRAGRPQFDREGEGIIVTSHQELQYYLSLFNMQLPIESQMYSNLIDHLNAEVALGTISSRQDAVTWLGYTYLYVRMMREPATYSVERTEQDPFLRTKRAELIHSACIILEKCGLIRYDKRSGIIHGTYLGKVASHFYISHKSIKTFQQNLRSFMSEIDLFRIFSLSDEFSLIPVREEEKCELVKLYEKIPIPIKESYDDPCGKINILLQAYISRLNLDGYALNSDLAFVSQNAARLFRGIFEIALKNGWSKVAFKALELSKMIQKRQWASMTPLRQFSEFPVDLIRSLERRDFPFKRMFDLSPQELGELVRSAKSGNLIHSFLRKFPRISATHHILPISRNTIKVELMLQCSFEFDPSISESELFWIFVEDVTGEKLLYYDTVVFKSSFSADIRTISFTLPLFEPMSPNYFISIVSDSWIGSSITVPVLLDSLALPSKFNAPTELLDLELIKVEEFFPEEFVKNYPFTHLNPIQTQIAHFLRKAESMQLHINEGDSVNNGITEKVGNIFIGAPSGSGKMLLVEHQILRHLKLNPSAKIIYVTSKPQYLSHLQTDWASKFKLSVEILSNDTSINLDKIQNSSLILAPLSNYEIITRRIKSKKILQSVTMVICDEIHTLASPIGPLYESLLTRLKIMSQSLENFQLILLSYPIANYKDICEWLDIEIMFNFSPSALRQTLDIIGVSLSGSHSNQLAQLSRMMRKEKGNDHADGKNFVLLPNAKFVRLAAEDYSKHVDSIHESINSSEKKRNVIDCTSITGSHLVNSIKDGFAFVDEKLSPNEINFIFSLFESNQISLLFISKEIIWTIHQSLKCDSLYILGNECFDCREHAFVEYSLADLFHILGKYRTRAVFYCREQRIDFYRKFLFDPFPVESHLHLMIHDFLLAEICSTKTITNKQDAVDYLSWTFLTNRLAKNQSYYHQSSDVTFSTSNYLSEIIENSLSELDGKFLRIPNDFDIEPLNLGLVASFYGISFSTVDNFHQSVSSLGTSSISRRKILDLICDAAEIDDFLVSQGENSTLSTINNSIPYKFSVNNDFYDTHIKASLLIQMYLSRIADVFPNYCNSLSFTSNMNSLLPIIHNLLLALVDVCASCSILSVAIQSMELYQSLTQQMWDSDSYFMQLPHFTKNISNELKSEFRIESIYDLMEMSNPDKEKFRQWLITRIDNSSYEDVMNYIHYVYPNITVDFSVLPLEQNEFTVSVKLQRESTLSDANGIPHVNKQGKRMERHEGWWIVIGSDTEKELLAIKKVHFAQSLSVDVRFNVSEARQQGLKLYLMSDSYLGCDQEFNLFE